MKDIFTPLWEFFITEKNLFVEVKKKNIYIIENHYYAY